MQSKPRTNLQNKSIHKYFSDVAKECKNQGLTLKQLLNVFEIEIDEIVIKKMAQQIGLVKYGKPHTSDMTTKELADVIDNLIKTLAFAGLETNFPSANYKSFLKTYDK